MKALKGSKLRRSRTIDPSNKGRWIYTWISISGFHRLKFRKLCNGNRNIPNREVPEAKRIVWAIEESAKRTSGAPLTQSQTLLTISKFCRVKFRTHCIRIRDIAKSEAPMG
jgi:hypothetical protein